MLSSFHPQHIICLLYWVCCLSEDVTCDGRCARYLTDQEIQYGCLVVNPWSMKGGFSYNPSLQKAINKSNSEDIVLLNQDSWDVNPSLSHAEPFIPTEKVWGD